MRWEGVCSRYVYGGRVLLTDSQINIRSQCIIFIPEIHQKPLVTIEIQLRVDFSSQTKVEKKSGGAITFLYLLATQL